MLQVRDLVHEATHDEIYLHWYIRKSMIILPTGLPKEKLSVIVGGEIVVWTIGGLVYSRPNVLKCR